MKKTIQHLESLQSLKFKKFSAKQILAQIFNSKLTVSTYNRKLKVPRLSDDRKVFQLILSPKTDYLAIVYFFGDVSLLLN